MAPEALHSVTVLEQCHVSPAPAPAAEQPRTLPLTFFDLAFWGLPPVQRLFFYDNADLLEVSDFTLAELPKLKDSLAAALHHFYPLAGKLARELAEGVAPPAPEVVFAHGDSVPLTVAVSGDDFEDLAGDHARDTTRLHPLLPALRRHAGGGGSRSQDQEQDVLAVQVTVFPRAGICIGTTLHHAVADGSSYAHFLSTWAAIHRLGKKAAVMDAPPPRQEGGGAVVLATFRFTDKKLRALGRHVESETSARCSPYALACGAAWAGIVHARGRGRGDGEFPVAARFGFVTGCKPRASPPIPASYFGNCLGLCRVEAKEDALTAAAAAAAIWRVIEGLAEEGGAFRDARGWVRWVREYASARAVTVAGSPKLRMYAAADLGGAWGRPRKVEIASVERTGALALAESGRDGDGGIEVGLALPRAEMEAFQAFYLDLFDRLW
ncbi:unnamed protein product [Urochloa humidicola]